MIDIYKNEQGLAAAFPCSQAPLQPRPRVPGTLGKGDLAARKCCYQPHSFLYILISMYPFRYIPICIEIYIYILMHLLVFVYKEKEIHAKKYRTM